MYTYIGLTVFYLLCMVIEKISTKKINRNVWTTILVLPLFIISAFRAPSVGNDTYNYFISYNIVSKEPFFAASQSRLEIGYIIYMRIIALSGVGYLGFQFITSTFIFSSICRFVKRHSNNIAFTFFVFMTSQMFFASMNITRQYLAIAILLFSIESIKDRKFIKFCIFVLIATSIHFTAITFLVVYPLVNLKLNRTKTIILLLIGSVVSLLFNQVVRIFVNITGRYANYLESGYFNFEDNIAIYLSLGINLCFFLVAFFTRYWKGITLQKGNIGFKRHNQTEILKVSDDKLWYVFCLLTLILSIIGLNATIMNRVESYFSIFFLVYIPSVIKNIRRKEIRGIVTVGIIIGLFSSFVVVMVYRPYWTTVFPYEWFWNWG